jgi:hypothetical protein
VLLNYRCCWLPNTDLQTYRCIKYICLHNDQKKNILSFRKHDVLENLKLVYGIRSQIVSRNRWPSCSSYRPCIQTFVPILILSHLKRIKGMHDPWIFPFWYPYSRTHVVRIIVQINAIFWKKLDCFQNHTSIFGMIVIT